MAYTTYSEILAAVKQETDMEDEDFVQSTEWLRFCNQAIHKAETVILGIGEDYFLDSATIDLVQGQSAYALPSDIYADKLRKLVYSVSNEVYRIKRLRFKESLTDLSLISSSERYRFLLTNDITAGKKIVLYPAARSTETAVITAWYIRKARTVTATTDEVDLPEFRAFIEKYMIWKAFKKERTNSTATNEAKADLDEEQGLMVAALSNRVPDDDDELEQDETHYEDHS